VIRPGRDARVDTPDKREAGADATRARVLRLLSDGLSNEGIGKQLLISAETVRTHVRKAMAKPNADNRTEAVATALRAELIA
jgi:DNA-binding NarL/FixJ family response regulator